MAKMQTSPIINTFPEEQIGNTILLYNSEEFDSFYDRNYTIILFLIHMYNTCIYYTNKIYKYHLHVCTVKMECYIQCGHSRSL